MNLSDHLLSQFAKITNDKHGKSERTLYGTVVKKDGNTYVQLDGSGILTPVYTTVDTVDGERVMVTLKNHTAIIVGNMSSPAARSKDIHIADENIEKAAKTATDYIRNVDDVMILGDHENDTNTDILMAAKSLHFYIKSMVELYKPYYESGDSVDVEWTGSGFVSDSSGKVYFSVPLARPVLGNPSVIVTSLNGLKIRQNGSYTHGSSNSVYVRPTYSATLSCDGGIVNVVVTLSSTVNAVNEAPCGLTASLKIAFS